VELLSETGYRVVNRPLKVVNGRMINRDGRKIFLRRTDHYESGAGEQCTTGRE
jgi:hypothetical protein